MNGIFNIDKPAGWTSHDVVAWVRRLLRIKRVGHAGTLDPLATGVLLVCVGQATRVSEFLMSGAKTYLASARLGIVTDTYDVDGQVIASQPVPPLNSQEIQAALAPFVGDIMQTPPAYSAIKQDGVPLHRRARRGEAVQATPRPVRIHGITLVDWQPPHLTLEVSCDPGTYIRSLVHDLGQNLGCGAVMTALRRMRSGGFRVEDAQSLEAISEAGTAGRLDDYLHPISAALSDLTPVEVTPEAERQLRNGQAIACPVAPDTAAGYAVAPNGSVAAILAYHPVSATWRPEKVFAVEGNNHD